MLRPLAIALMLLPATASAAERRVALGSFERLRINGAFDVTVTTGGSPGAIVSGDAGAIGDVDLHAEGTTLAIRGATSGRWGEQPAGARTGPVKIVLTTPRLSSVTVTGGSRVAVSRLSGARMDVTSAGSGGIAVAAVDGDQLGVQLIGEGKVSVAGRVAGARLLANGAGAIDAAKLDAGDLTAHLEGLGTIAARARYTAQVSSNGLGTVTVAGRPKCRVTAAAGAPVTCGTGE